MGTVRINFLGVCTIFRALPSMPQPTGLPSGILIPQNRVVLPRATESFMRITGIEPHIAMLQLSRGPLQFNGPQLPPADPPLTNTYALNGVAMRITNARDTAISPERGLDCLPSLSAFLNGDLGPPATYVYVPDTPNVQAVFDVQGGSWQSYLMNPDPPCATVPSISILTMETDGDPVLEYKPFVTNIPPTIPPTLVTLADDSDVFVMNFAHGEAFVDDNGDFLLNYWLAETFPPVLNIGIPQNNACRSVSPVVVAVIGCGDAGPGCSNTNYP